MAYIGYGGSPPQNPNVGEGYSTSQDRGPGTPVVGGMGGDPGQGYYQQQGYPQQIPTNPMSAQYGQLQGMLDLYGPTMALSNAFGQQQITGLEGQNYWNDQSLQNQMNSANQGAMYQMAGLGLQGQQQGIQQAALARQLGNLPAQYGLQTQGFGLQEQQIGLGEQGAQAGAQTARRGLDSSMTASGAYTSIGANQGRGDISSQLARQMQGYGINRQQVGLQRQGAAMNYMEQTAQMQDAQKELGIQSKQLGLNESEVKSRLDNALNQLGIQGQVSADQLLAETAKIKQGMVSPLSGLISMIGQQTNLPLLAGGGQ